MIHLRRFNESIDFYDDNMCGRSESWLLFRFKSLYEYKDFETTISPNFKLISKFNFSDGKFGIDDSIANFNYHQVKSGDLYVLINRDFTPQNNYMHYFNCNGVDIYGVFDSKFRRYDAKYFRSVINDIDYIDSDSEHILKKYFKSISPEIKNPTV